MSRRQSRVSVDTRQSDTLLEFENFKKKFLLANKHITKLNSTLSVRIEELNAQISTLYVENLRLRASEIALTSQLKKEREKSRKILVDAENATQSLMKHFGLIRKSFNISHQVSTTPELTPPPRARRPAPNTDASLAIPRLARPPTIPGIIEDDEDEALILEEGILLSPTPQRRKSKPRASLVRAREEVALIQFDEDLSKAGKRKPTRRQSGLLTTKMAVTVSEVMTPRPPSPAFGSPLRRDAALEEDDEVITATSAPEPMDEDEDEEPTAVAITRRDKKRKQKELDEREKYREKEGEREFVAESSRRDREKRRTRDSDETSNPFEAKKPKLKDVTNSPPPRPSLATLEISQDRDRQRTPDKDPPPMSSSSTSTAASFGTARSFLTPATTATPLPRTSSLGAREPSPTNPSSEPETQPSGRERRVRKSVNYAEPKLNTKMRKPDPPPSTSTNKRGSSASEVPASRKSATEVPAINQFASSSGDTTANQAQSVGGVKRKKSRVYIPVDEEDESEGAQADAEFGGTRTDGSSGWVNDSRRRSLAHHASTSRRTDFGDELRRHSMAV
ncbi:hypothetical protein BDY19DRAFT_1043065 [Irpex rosettiformis]|uniref:Uncharacterized protein n=1 Tax=Irpex rosettiformis TaxID=378272 RepID=A0ACB8TV40_9APHY|nr:hypothetical protein BDY19DRAFT_1043065 [Irpex rosettiformis]